MPLQLCIHLRTCDNLHEDGTEFATGQRQCELEKPSYSKVLIATGSPWSTSVLTEVIDLADESTSCEALGDFPIQVSSASGGLINDRLPLICGGFGEGVISGCYIAGGAISDPVIKLFTPRGYSAAVVINSHQLWVTGGLDDKFNDLASTEIVDILANPPTVVPGPELPEPMNGHCIVQLNQSTVFFMGGEQSKKTFFFDASTLTWTNGPDMNHDRWNFGCGLMTTGSDLLVVASGGFDSPTTTELLNLGDPNGLKWSAGKN